MSVIHLTKETFDSDIKKSGVTALIDFYADWCGPCKMLAPIIETVANEVQGVKICKVNVDEESDLAAKFSVMSIPTLVLMKDGEVVDTHIGLIAKQKLLDFIAKA